MTSEPGDLLRGVIPVAPTVFRADETLDLDGQRRVADFLVDAEADGICLLANYSEQFALTDDERTAVIEASVDQVAERVPLCVAVSHFSARVAAHRAHEAQERGASMVMLMPPFVGATMTVPDAVIVEYFERVADGLEIDMMLQDAPLSPTRMSVGLLAELGRRIPQLRYVKIEMPQTAEKLAQLGNVAGSDLPGLFDGEEGITLVPDLEAGARGTMCSSMVPDQLGRVVRDFHQGRREEAVARWEHWLPLIHFENRQCGLRAAKVLLEEGGIIDSALTRAPIPSLDVGVRRQLVQLARRRDPLVLRWAHG